SPPGDRMANGLMRFRLVLLLVANPAVGGGFAIQRADPAQRLDKPAILAVHALSSRVCHVTQRRLHHRSGMSAVNLDDAVCVPLRSRAAKPSDNLICRLAFNV